MPANLIPFIVLWVLLSLSVAVLVVWRKSVASQEDDSIHVLQGSVAQQLHIAQKLEAIDKWGKILTAATVVFGLILGAIWMYQNWVMTSNIQSGV